MSSARREPKLDTAPPRGMRDILPDEAEIRDFAVTTILGVYRRFGFRRIETPALESLHFLTGGDGGENEKLIFKVLKRGEKLRSSQTEASDAELADLGLRFDLTVPLARYFAHNQAKLPYPLKAIQIGPVWRAERPQHGRYRQFTQCDIDILGEKSELAEIELIAATSEALLALGLHDFRIRLNDRRILIELARHCGFEDRAFNSVFIALDKLDKIGLDGVQRELDAAGHARAAVAKLVEAVRSFTERAGAGLAALPFYREGDEPYAGLGRIQAAIEQLASGYTIEYDPTLVRGMSYYTGPIFEISYGREALSIAGGGRYDEMIAKISGRSVPASGFSIGFERTVAILGARRDAGRTSEDRLAILFDPRQTAAADAVRIARDARRKHDVVLVEVKRKNFSKQLDDLKAQGIRRYAVLRPGVEDLHLIPLDGEAAAPRPADRPKRP
jgi:histidyl-tRNA synthetase